MIIFVKFEDGFFSGYSECERYALAVENMTEAQIFETKESANKVIESYGGEIVFCETE